MQQMRCVVLCRCRHVVAGVDVCFSLQLQRRTTGFQFPIHVLQVLREEGKSRVLVQQDLVELWSIKSSVSASV